MNNFISNVFLSAEHHYLNLIFIFKKNSIRNTKHDDLKGFYDIVEANFISKFRLYHAKVLIFKMRFNLF